MNLKALKNTEELQTFLNGTQAVAFSMVDKKARYDFIQSTLKQFHYRMLNKRQKMYRHTFPAASDCLLQYEMSLKRAPHSNIK